jgi:hypothetical protein
VIRGAPQDTALSGHDAELSFQASLVSGIINNFIEGILKDDPSGFIASTFMGYVGDCFFSAVFSDI